MVGFELALDRGGRGRQPLNNINEPKSYKLMYAG